MNKSISEPQIAIELETYLSKLEDVAHLRPKFEQRQAPEPEQISLFDVINKVENTACIFDDVPVRSSARERILQDLTSGKLNKNSAMLSLIFSERFEGNDTPISFTKETLIAAAETLGLALPQNLSDVVYALRHRSDLPDAITKTAGAGKEWIIETAGRSRYRLIQRPSQKVVADPSSYNWIVKDWTPGIARKHGLKDAALLECILRHNRLLENFLGLPTEHLQSHIRTSIAGFGQTEIGSLFLCDEAETSIPVCLIGKPGEFNLGKAAQHMRFGFDRFPDMQCRTVVAQLLDDHTVALFELFGTPKAPRVIQEAHYILTPRTE